jgi:hypothetical protein
MSHKPTKNVWSQFFRDCWLAGITLAELHERTKNAQTRLIAFQIYHSLNVALKIKNRNKQREIK